jgi:hypothetical protein
MSWRKSSILSGSQGDRDPHHHQGQGMTWFQMWPLVSSRRRSSSFWPSPLLAVATSDSLQRKWLLVAS